MAEFDDKLNQLLSNPDSMAQIMRLAQYEIARSRQPFAVYIAVALIYFACTYLTNFALRKVERRLAIPDIS